MESITLKVCDDGNIWVTSDDDQIGIDYVTTNGTDKTYQFTMALSHFLAKRKMEGMEI